MRNLHFFISFFLVLFSIAQKSPNYLEQISLENKSDGKQLKASKVSQGKKVSKVKSLAKTKNDTLTIEILHINTDEYWTYHVLTKTKKDSWVSTFRLDHDLRGSLVDKIEFYNSPELFFTMRIEKHSTWHSNYGKGKSLSKGIFLFKVVDNKLYYKYFEESIERSGVDYRTGSFNEKNNFQKVTIENGNVQFFYPKDDTKKNYKMTGVVLNLQED